MPVYPISNVIGFNQCLIITNVSIVIELLQIKVNLCFEVTKEYNI